MALPDFPFTIIDVARLCGLQVMGDKGSSEYIDCPFCGRKKKLNLHYEKGQYNCPACGSGGSMLKLYAELTGNQNLKNAEIVQKIKTDLGISDTARTTKHRQNKQNTESKPEIDFEAMKSVDSALRGFLCQLKLAETHRAKLQERGLSDEDIERYIFKSVPVFGAKSFAQKVAEAGIQLNGVPGFYIDGSGKWNVNINPKLSGYFVPCHNYFGYIEGLQIRLDNPLGKAKYFWLSSNNMKNGTGAHAAPFYVKGNRKNDTLVITEGAFKAIVPNKLFGYHILAVPGVNNISPLKALMPYIKRDYSNILVAFDADAKTNENVERAKNKLIAFLRENGMGVENFTWNINEFGKGLDDFALNWVSKHTRTT